MVKVQDRNLNRKTVKQTDTSLRLTISLSKLMISREVEQSMRSSSFVLVRSASFGSAERRKKSGIICVYFGSIFSVGWAGLKRRKNSSFLKKLKKSLSFPSFFSYPFFRFLLLAISSPCRTQTEFRPRLETSGQSPWTNQPRRSLRDWRGSKKCWLGFQRRCRAGKIFSVPLATMEPLPKNQSPNWNHDLKPGRQSRRPKRTLAKRCKKKKDENRYT